MQHEAEHTHSEHDPGDQTHPDSPSGQPYSAPARPTQAWGGNADPRNLSYEPEGLRYFGPGWESSEQPNDVPWPNTLPPPQTYSSPGRTWTANGDYSQAPPVQPPKPRSWFARHKVLTGLLAVAALFLVVGIIGAVTA